MLNELNKKSENIVAEWIRKNVEFQNSFIMKVLSDLGLVNGTITSITTMIDLGFDDLDRVELIMKLEKEFSIDLNIFDGFEDSDNANTIYDKIKDYLRK